MPVNWTFLGAADYMARGEGELGQSLPLHQAFQKHFRDSLDQTHIIIM